VIGEQLSNLSSFIPAGAIEVIEDQLRRLASHGEQALGFTFLTGLLLSLWSANAGMKALFDALNIVYDETEKRSFFRLNIISLEFTFGAIVFIMVTLAAVVVLPVALKFIGLERQTEFLLTVVRWPAILMIVAVAIALIYRHGPSREKAKWRWITWGSVLASLLWLGVSMLFSWYATNFGKYNETYGSLGAVVGFMVWIWLSSIVILLGAELDAEMEHQTAKDTTEGQPKPLGARGATMADTVGPAQTR
jgi:membrane protein